MVRPGFSRSRHPTLERVLRSGVALGVLGWVTLGVPANLGGLGDTVRLPGGHAQAGGQAQLLPWPPRPGIPALPMSGPRPLTYSLGALLPVDGQRAEVMRLFTAPRSAASDYFISEARREVTLRTRRTGDRLLVTGAPEPAHPLLGLSFDLKTGELRVPEGFSAWPVALSGPGAWDNQPRGEGALWGQGYIWNLLGSDTRRGNAIRGQLLLVRLDSGDVVLSYRKTAMLRHDLSSSQVILKY